MYLYLSVKGVVHMKKIRVSIYNIKPGMRAAGDVFSTSGQLLVSNGATFTDETLERLNLYSIPFVTIYDDEESEQVSSPDASYAERIKNSIEFHFLLEFLIRAIKNEFCICVFINLLFFFYLFEFFCFFF